MAHAINLRESKTVVACNNRPITCNEVGEPFLDMRVIYRDKIEVARRLTMRVAHAQGKPHMEMRGRPFESSRMMVD
jgi:hypothetical protein